MIKPFDKIKLSQMYVLCNTVAEAQVRNVGNIRRRYLDRALHFDETLSLLNYLKIIKSHQNELSLSRAFSTAFDSAIDFGNKLLPVLFAAKREVSGELRLFLSNFQIENNQITFKASELQKIKFSDTRNLLLELEFISVSEDKTTYYVNPMFKEVFVRFFNRKKLSPKSLKKKLTENELIGFLAEKAIIDFELKRLAVLSIAPEDIEHTAQHNVLAGYDIKSFEDYIDVDSKRIERFIEVKAVAVSDYKFYWSKIEMEIAKIFGDMYYLYLLPIDADNSFAFDKMIIKRNPFKSVYSNKQEWHKEEETISFSKQLITN